MAVAFVPVAIFGAGLSIKNAVVFAVGLLAGNVPEGLLPVITLALAVAVRALAKQGAVVKRLSAVETLGSTDVICTDKTGTLTENRMRPVAVWTPEGLTDLAGASESTVRVRAGDAALTALARGAVACNNARLEESGEHVGDPTEIALMLTGGALGAPTDPDQRQRARVALFHFEPHLKLMSTADRDGDQLWLHTKGAPEAVLARCETVLDPGGEAVQLDDPGRKRIAEQIERFSADGLRVIAVATRPLPDGPLPKQREQVETALTLLGLVAMEDPPRPEVAQAVASCHRAGIRILVITGDHPLTAAAIARRVGIGGERAPRTVMADAIEAMPQTELTELLANNEELVFARATPEAKLRIAETLRELGHVVAMTGDGVNDAPALRRADIGVAMGVSGTDVAREAATMVLSDDNFATIVAAIEAGRRVYDNVRKFIVYIFAHATPEVVPFLVFARGRPIPGVRARRRAHPAPADRAPATRVRRRLGNAPLARARARPSRARKHGPAAATRERGRDQRPDARARVAVSRPDRGRIVDQRLLLRAGQRRLASGGSGRRRPSAAPRIPAGDHDVLRRHDRRADRHRVRGAHPPRLATIDRRVQQSLPLARDRRRGAVRRAVRVRAAAAEPALNRRAAGARRAVLAPLPVHRLGRGRATPVGAQA
jgi:phosphoserine phosphatase